MISEQMFQNLVDVVLQQQRLLADIAEHLTQIESIGGGGSASIEDYVPGTVYKRNMLIVDTNTETVYRVVTPEYTSVTIQDDAANGMIKVVGFESQIRTFNHNPTQAEINVLPDDTIVAVYSSNDSPYQPVT